MCGVIKELILILLSSTAFASYCGQSAIPYSFEALASGQPVLGCARPSCFGWNADGKRSADSAQFYRVGKVADGFLRSSDTKGPVVKNVSSFQPQYSICEQSYISAHCSGATWVGGIAPAATVDSKNPFKLMCCSYNKLSESLEEGRVEIRPGQVVRGGEVKNADERQTSFEYIANVQRLFDRNGVVYVLTMKKFPCVPVPIAPVSGIESETANFLIDNINAVSENKRLESPENNPKDMFNEQKFDLPHDMPQEQSLTKFDAGGENAPDVLNAINKPLNRVHLGIPHAKAMMDDVTSLETPTALPPSKLFSAVDVKSTDYQKVVSPADLKQQMPYSQPNINGQSLASNQQNLKNQPLNQAQQYNYYGYNQQQQQQQYPYAQFQSQPQFTANNQQPQLPLQNMLDPSGMFHNLGIQGFNNQQYAPLSYTPPAQGSQQFSSVATLFPSFTLVTPAPLLHGGLPAAGEATSGATTYKGEHPNNSAAIGPKPSQQYEVVGVVDSAPVSGFSVPRIPTPEEIENAVSPASKRLITAVTKTLFGYSRYA